MLKEMGRKRYSMKIHFTWSASLSYRSTCPSSGGGCWGSLPQSGRIAASPPASRARGPGHSDTWWSRSNSAAAGRMSWCRRLCHQYWMSASGNRWASDRKCPANSHTPAFLALREGWKALYTGITWGYTSLTSLSVFYSQRLWLWWSSVVNLGCQINGI